MNQISLGLTSVEKVVSAAWARALRCNHIERDADFRTTRMNTNRALQIIRDIWSETGIELPPNVFFEAPTIRLMAEILLGDGALANPDLVCLRDGVGKPLFLFPGAGSVLLDLRDLVDALDFAGPIYGIPFAGLDGKEPLHTTFEAEGQRSAAIVRRVQPEGPHRLIGYSMGGVTALETARVLHADEGLYPILGLLDTALNDHSWPVQVWLSFMLRKYAAGVRRKLVQSVRRRKAGVPIAERAKLQPPRRGMHLVFRFLNPESPEYPFYSPFWETHHPPHYSHVRATAGRMRGRYTPSIYKGPVYFFAAVIPHSATCDPQAVWPKYLPNAEWIRVAGSHLTIILGRNAKGLSARIFERFT